jgi:hypothetical protein
VSDGRGFSDWLERRSAWQFAAACTACVFVAGQVVGGATPWVIKGRFDLAYLLGYWAALAVATTAGTTSRDTSNGAAGDPDKNHHLASGGHGSPNGTRRTGLLPARRGRILVTFLRLLSQPRPWAGSCPPSGLSGAAAPLLEVSR